MFIHELYSPYPMLLCHPVYAMAFLHDMHPRHVPNNSGCSHAPVTSCTMLDDAEFTKHRQLQSITCIAQHMLPLIYLAHHFASLRHATTRTLLFASWARPCSTGYVDIIKPAVKHTLPKNHLSHGYIHH